MCISHTHTHTHTQVEVMTKSMCATTVHAIRDTELACLPAGLLNTIKLKHPQVVSRLIQVLGERILGNYTRMASPISSISTASLAGEGGGLACEEQESLVD